MGQLPKRRGVCQRAITRVERYDLENAPRRSIDLCNAAC